MFPIFNLGPLAIRADGLIILLGVWLWFYINDQIAKRFSVNSDLLSNHIFYSFMLGIVGARISLILQQPQVFLDNPLSIISLNLSLFDLPAGIIVGILSFLIFTQRKKQPLTQTLDTISPGLLIFGAFISLSMLANGKLYGIPSDLPWSIYLWGTLRHPLQIYYLVLFCLSAFFVFRLTKQGFPAGVIFWITTSLISLIIIFLEAFRGTTAFTINNFHIPQMLSFIILMFGSYKLKTLGKLTTNNEENG